VGVCRGDHGPGGGAAAGRGIVIVRDRNLCIIHVLQVKMEEGKAALSVVGDGNAIGCNADVP